MAETTAMRRQLAIVLISVMAGAGTVFGDGGMFFRHAAHNAADVFQPTQKVYIRWDGSQEKLLIQTKYEGPAEEMVWIVPVPSEPTVQRADGSIFNELGKRTYGLAIDFTDFAGLDIYTFGGSAGGSASSTSPAVWHERLGDYDVALLRPVGENDVIQWLNANDFAVPEEIQPVLGDYVRDGWWMVASRIHPDALSTITSEKLAKGALHPLEMTFQSSACVYPMRLTSMAAGPVEELIYIEGPAHYEPATLTDAPWDIKLYGGPTRKMLTSYPLSDLENAAAVSEGKTQVQTSPRLTKLRRVFQPEEMTEDIVFREIDLGRWLASTEPVPLTPYEALVNRQPDPHAQASFALQLANSAPMRIAQAATQYGRWRDPNGIDPLVAALSPDALDQVRPNEQDYLSWPFPSSGFLSWRGIDKWSWSTSKQDWPQHPGCGHLRSCIWALGEIGIEHEIGSAAVDKLLECAQHENQLIRMAAYIALTKTRTERLGPILVDRLARVFAVSPLPALWWHDFQVAEAEISIAAEWIGRFGALQQKQALVDLLRRLTEDIHGSPLYFGSPEAITVSANSWPEWIVGQAANTRDERLISALEDLRSRLSPDRASYEIPFLLAAEAACGSSPAYAAVTRSLLDSETGIVSSGQAPGTGGITSLANLNYAYDVPPSLRVCILHRRGLACVLFPMPTEAADSVIRSALSEQTISDWYALYLLAGIKIQQADDKEKLMRIWNSREPDRRLLAVDVLYVWGNEQMLMDLYDQAEFAKVRSEIAWALAALGSVGGRALIEEQIRESWNAEWLSLSKTFIHHGMSDLRGRYPQTGLPIEIERNEQALWHYFHPLSEVLDDERLAALKRIAADRTIHAGMRFDLLGVDYGGTEWGLPLLEQAARDVLAIDSSSSTTQRILSMMKSVGNGGFAIDSPSN